MFVVLLVVVATLTNLPALVAGECTFDLEWRGTWFQSNTPDLISISANRISSKGSCVAQDRDKFLIQQKDDPKCYMCLVITVKHPNVLQYKESHLSGQKGLCFGEDVTRDEINIDDVCKLILGDANLYSMFKETSSAIPCPFKPPYQFTYDDGYQVCDNRDSRIDSCADDTKVIFRQKSCPDWKEQPPHDREFACVGEWTEGSNHYLVGKFLLQNGSRDDMYRCTAYEKKGTTINIAMSADATCRGLLSPKEGPYNYVLKQQKYPASLCQFPRWLSGMPLRDLAANAIFQTDQSNNSMRILNITTGKTVSHLRCHIIRSAGISGHMELVTYSVNECNHGFQCVRLWQRGVGHIIEMQRGQLVNAAAAACLPRYLVRSTWTTIMGAAKEPSTCPITGIFEATEPFQVLPWARYEPINNCLETEASVTFEASCEDRTKIRINAACNTNQARENNEITCSGHWEDPDSGKTYLIAKSPIDTRPYCYALRNIYTREGRVIKHVSRTPECRGPTEGILNFPWFPLEYNLTRKGSCSYGGGGSSSGISANSATSLFAPSFSSSPYSTKLSVLLQPLLALLQSLVQWLRALSSDSNSLSLSLLRLQEPISSPRDETSREKTLPLSTTSSSPSLSSQIRFKPTLPRKPLPKRRRRRPPLCRHRFRRRHWLRRPQHKQHSSIKTRGTRVVYFSQTVPDSCSQRSSPINDSPNSPSHSTRQPHHFLLSHSLHLIHLSLLFLQHFVHFLQVILVVVATYVDFSVVTLIRQPLLFVPLILLLFLSSSSSSSSSSRSSSRSSSLRTSSSRIKDGELSPESELHRR